MIVIGIREGILLFLLCGLAGCGGGSSSHAPSRGSPGTSAPPAPDNSQGELLSGTFADGPVAGLHYQSSTAWGTTSASGVFRYRSNDSVTFALGGIVLGQAKGSDLVSPLSLFSLADFDEARTRGLDDQVVNILVLLQSLDRDWNPANGIDLGGLDQALQGERLDFPIDTNDFLQGNSRRIINRQHGHYRAPVPGPS